MAVVEREGYSQVDRRPSEQCRSFEQEPRPKEQQVRACQLLPLTGHLAATCAGGTRASRHSTVSTPANTRNPRLNTVNQTTLTGSALKRSWCSPEASSTNPINVKLERRNPRMARGSIS